MVNQLNVEFKGSRMFFFSQVCVRGAYVPADSDVQRGSSDDDVQVYFDIDSVTGQTENKPLGYFQDLMTNPKLKLLKQENSDPESDQNKIPVSPEKVGKVSADKHEKFDVGSKGKPLEDITGGSGIVAQDSPATGRTTSSNADTDTSRRPADNMVCNCVPHG